jgi:branched-chain amino acid transport system permease protein
MEIMAFLVGLLTLALIYGLLALALNVQFGYAGVLNFGHVAFFAAGAFASAIITLPPAGSPAYVAAGAHYAIGLGLPFVVGVIGAGVCGGLLALLIGLTSIRLSSHYLAIGTFAMAEVFHSFLVNEEWLTGGQFGITNVPRPGEGTLVSVDWYADAYLLLIVVVVVALLFVTVRITESPFGRVLRAIRSDELSTRVLAKETWRYKLQAFMLGGVLAGIAGSLWIHSLGVVHVRQFIPIVTFQVWLAMLIGGVGNHRGVFVGALLLVAIQEGTRFLADVPGLSTLAAGNPSFLPSLRLVLVGLLLVLVIRFFPRGIMPARKRKALPARGNEEGGPA